MANTVIAIRSSGTTSRTPSLGVIANGELSLNYADGILYYKTSSNTLGSIRTTQPAGLTTEIQFNDAGSFGSNSNFTFNKTTGLLSTTLLKSTQSAGDEGGQLDLATSATNTTLAGGSVAIDVYQNRIRIFETGGTNRGVYIDLANGAGAGVSTNLISGSAAVTSVAGATGAVSNNQILAGLLTVDGLGSGLDADLLDGLNSASFANAAFANTDYTTISATATTYGNASFVPVTTLAANGRVSSIVNTAIAISTTQITSGVLPFAQGGANATSYTTGALLTSNGTAIVSLANTGTAGTYGNASYVPVITTDAYGRVTSVTNTAITTSGATIGDVLALSIALG
jgi:hypothetical protein